MCKNRPTALAVKSWNNPPPKKSSGVTFGVSLLAKPRLIEYPMFAGLFLFDTYIMQLKQAPDYPVPVGYMHAHIITSPQSPPLPSLPRPFTPDLKLISFTNPFLHRLSGSPGMPSRILTCTELCGHWRLFLCFFFVFLTEAAEQEDMMSRYGNGIPSVAKVPFHSIPFYLNQATWPIHTHTYTHTQRIKTLHNKT